MSNAARLTRIVRFGDARPDLPRNTLFHAGPPYAGSAPMAVQKAAQQAAIIGGLAPNAETAARMLADGTLRLAPAQDVNLVAPLAQVVSADMWCFEVSDGTHTTHAPLGEGPPPALRFGSDDPVCVSRARDWCSAVADALNPLLAAQPIDPYPLMLAALEEGDDCHARTMAGNELFLAAVPSLPEELVTAVRSNAGFVLCLWMAWCAWKLRADGGALRAIGGNGLQFGVRLQGDEDWRTVDAPPPVGIYFQPDQAPQSLGAIGDSAVVDACGFGGQALKHAPSLLEEWAAVLPNDAATRPTAILNPKTGAIDVARIVATATPPIINLAILHRDGAGAPIGRGHYCPPVTLFNRGENAK
jgi:hypothetical protein